MRRDDQYSTEQVNITKFFGKPDDVYMIVQQKGQNWNGDKPDHIAVCAVRVTGIEDYCTADDRGVKEGISVKIGNEYIEICAATYEEGNYGIDPEEKPLDPKTIPVDIMIALGMALDRFTQ